MDIKYPFRELCDQWRKLIEVAKRQRHEEFGTFAEETEKFFDSDHSWMWQDEYAKNEQNGFLRKDGNVRMPNFRVTINKVVDAVDLYGPALMHRYPKVMVEPVYQPECSPESLMIQDEQGMEMYYQIKQQQDALHKHRDTCADIAEKYLNWVQFESDKKAHSRLAITDAIVSGLGLLYHELYWPRGGMVKYPRSKFIRWDQLVKDPDASTQEDVQWIAVEWNVPVNIAERKFGLEPGSLKGTRQTLQSQIDKKSQIDTKTGRKPSQSWDMIRYWEVYSKNGFGARLKSAEKLNPEVKDLVEQWGDFCYIAIAEDIPFPLNMPTEALQNETDEDLFERAHWPIPFYLDSGSGNDWPVSELAFRVNPKSKWPVSIFKSLIGEIRFVNWCMSFLADKVAASATDYIGVLKAAADDIQEQLSSQSGPVQLIKIDSQFGNRIDQVISMLGKPSFDQSLWTMVREVMDIIEKGSGVTELLYGQTSRQMRSSAEAQLLGGNASIRPDDMAEKTDEWYSLAAKKEWQAAVWLLNAEDVAPVLGEAGAWIFENRIVVEEFASIASDYVYRLAANSGRKPNKGQRLESLLRFSQVAMPMWSMLIEMGLPDPYNAFIEETAKALEIDDYKKFLVETEIIQQIIQQRQQQAQQQQQANQEAEEERVQQEHETKMQQENDKSEQKLYWTGMAERQKMMNTASQMRLKLVEDLIGAIGNAA